MPNEKFFHFVVVFNLLRRSIFLTVGSGQGGKNATDQTQLWAGRQKRDGPNTVGVVASLLEASEAAVE
jgi:hypothetical protein